MLIDSKLKFQDHIKQKINKAVSMLGILRRNFNEMDNNNNNNNNNNNTKMIAMAQ